MAVTISELLLLPALRNATVIGGHRGLGKPVTAVSVLEYAEDNRVILEKKSFSESELVLTSFSAIVSDYAAQCASLRALHEAGEAGLVLYYLGVFMPVVDKSLVQTADELDFPLICMPFFRADLRYSEVISEVMEAIVREKQRETEAMWQGRNKETAFSVLVSAILRDEPLKMRRLADVFHVNVAAINGMWVFRSEGRSWQKPTLELLRPILEIHCSIVLADEYEDCVVAFFDATGLPSELGRELILQLDELGIHTVMSECRHLLTTTDVRSAYLLSRKYQPVCRQIWPNSRRFNQQELRFAESLDETIANGEAAIYAALAPLEPIRIHRDGDDLLHTLAIYFLDCDCSVTKTALVMFLHKNTIKYRLSRMTEIMGYPVSKQPERFTLYHALALNRILEESQS